MPLILLYWAPASFAKIQFDLCTHCHQCMECPSGFLNLSGLLLKCHFHKKTSPDHLLYTTAPPLFTPLPCLLSFTALITHLILRRPKSSLRFSEDLQNPNELLIVTSPLSPLECHLHEGRSLVCFAHCCNQQYTKQRLAQSRSSINMWGMMGRKETLVSYATFCGYVHFPQSRDQSFWSPLQWALGAEFENHHKIGPG